ncbi:MAG TPA: hypothetical protein VHX36_13995 [Candidatus Acidoferrales bacterium]|jgi:hypothetical protein|nr:hypothetical protein [Candidatus Acidoferrales bacterium]
MRRSFPIAILLTLILAAGASLRAQDDSQGPIAPPPTYKINRIPSTPHPGPPPIPVQEIIQKFAANEDLAKQVYDTYDFTQTVRIEEIGDPGGKYTVTGVEYTRPDGKRYWRIEKPPVSTLKAETYTLEDVNTMISIPLFFLTTDELPNYDLVYAGQEQLDQLNTYVFQVKPKTLNRKRLFFQGVINVDDHDLAIVETYGKFVSELADAGIKLPFSLFEVYRENFQGKYWLPTYVSSDDYINQTDGGDPLHLRMVIRSTDFKLNPPSSPGSATPGAAPASPASAPK